MKTAALVVALAATFALAGCTRSEDRERQAEPHEMGSADGMPHGEEEIAFGSPGDPAQAARTIPVAALDTLRFDPDAIEVEEGQTITFSVANPGQAVHEFTLGDEPFQAEHESDMQSGSAMTTDTPYSVVVRPGETKKLTWRFTTKGKLLFGCHQPGHYQGGMVGSITIT